MACRLPFQQDVDFGNTTSHLGDCDGKMQQREMEASGWACRGEGKRPLPAPFSITPMVVNKDFTLCVNYEKDFCNMTCFDCLLLISLSELKHKLSGGSLCFGFRRVRQFN